MRREFELDSPNGYKISAIAWECPAPVRQLICLHGFAGSKRSLVISAVAEMLAEKNWNIMTFDWPGHGDSPAGADRLTVDNCLRDLDLIVGECRKNGLPLSCFATSFGGYLAMNYHYRNPDVFSSIMLRSPALRMDHVIRTLLEPAVFEAWKGGDKLDFGFDRPLVLGYSVYEDIKEHEIFSKPIAGHVSLEIIHGDQDELVPVEDSREYAAREGVKLTEVAGADHRYSHAGELEKILEAADHFLG